MFVTLNHEIVPAAEAVLPVTTEGLRFGSGCFETIAYTGGAPRFWARHMERFGQSCARLGLEPRVSPAQLRQLLAELVEKNAQGQQTVGEGLSPLQGQTVLSQCGAGQSSSASSAATAVATEGVVRVSAHQSGRFADVIMTFAPPRYSHPPESFALMLSQQRHPGVWAYSGIKHNNYVQFLATAVEASAAGVDEALLADASGHVLEGSRTNLFAVQKMAGGWRLCTAPLQSGVLPGVMRSVVLQIAPELGFGVSEAAVTVDELLRADGCFVTNALVGVVPVSGIGGHRFDAEANIVSAVLRQSILRLKE